MPLSGPSLPACPAAKALKWMPGAQLSIRLPHCSCRRQSRCSFMLEVNDKSITHLTFRSFRCHTIAKLSPLSLSIPPSLYPSPPLPFACQRLDVTGGKLVADPRDRWLAAVSRAGFEVRALFYGDHSGR